MVTLRSIIQEQNDQSSLDLNQVAQKINEDCQPFLSQAYQALNKAPLFRGMRPGPDFFVKNTISKRRPESINDTTHQIADEWFKQQFGHRFRSSNVMFATSKLSQTGIYGHPHIVFPIEQFSFVWSYDVPDLFTYLSKQHANTPEKIEQALDEAEYQSTNLHDALLSGNEIMFNVNRYYAIRFQSRNSTRSLINTILEQGNWK